MYEGSSLLSFVMFQFCFKNDMGSTHRFTVFFVALLVNYFKWFYFLSMENKLKQLKLKFIRSHVPCKYIFW